VLKDVREGWVSPEQAADAYGVILRADGSLDEEATAARRAELTAANPAPPTQLDVEPECRRIADSLADYLRPRI
jgi:N-methylhydantoinase B